MDADAKVTAVPAGMHALTPHLTCKGASDASAFYQKAFDAIELSRMPGPDGRLMHALLRIGDSSLMLVDEFPEWGGKSPAALGGTAVTIHLYVQDADATYAQAISAGASVHMPLSDMFWGDRYGVVTDPFGHQWAIATHVKDMTPEQVAAAGKAMMAEAARN